jgi:MFS family permease
VTVLGRNREFRRLFLAMVISFCGDWFLFVALTDLVFNLTHSNALTASLFATATVPFALFTFIGGPLADRLNRQWLMVGADVTRGFLALGFFFIHSQSQVWIVFALYAAISALGAVFDPAASAAIPNLVEPEDLGTANAITGATWGTMLAVGAALGGLVAERWGRGAGYTGDAISFFLSATIVLSIRGRFSEARKRGDEHPGLVRATREALRYAREDHRVLAVLSAKGVFGLGGGVVGLLPVLALTTFHAGDHGTGILYGFRGVGVLIGPFLFRRLFITDDLSRAFWGITFAFVLYGLAYTVAPWMPGIYGSASIILLAHLGGGAQWTLSTYSLQVLVPDRVRGRIFAFDYGLVTFTLALSAAVSGKIADYVDVRTVIFGLGCLMLLLSALWALATSAVRRSLHREAARAA